MAFDLEQKPCNTAKEFLDVLDPGSDFWQIGSGNWRRDWIFRGQPLTPGWRLIPKAFRLEKDENPSPDMTFARGRGEPIVTGLSFTQSHKQLIDQYGEKNTKQWFVQLYAEITNLREYIRFARTLNFDIDWPLMSDLPVMGNKFVNEFAAQLLNSSHAAETWGIPAFAVGQHHGLATRLLDWTRNAINAAFFAIQNLPDKAQMIAVYAIQNLLPGGRFQIVEVERSTSPYIAAQDGLFTLDTLADQEFLRTGRWSAFDEVYTGKIVEVTLPVTEARELARYLWLRGVTHAHMMPTLDNIVTSLKHKWRWQYPNKWDDGGTK